MVVVYWIWPNFDLIRDFTVVLFTCNNEEDPIKKEGARVFTTLYIDFSDAQGHVTVLQLGFQKGRVLEQKGHSAKTKKGTLPWNRKSVYPLSPVIIYPLNYNPYKHDKLV